MRIQYIFSPIYMVDLIEGLKRYLHGTKLSPIEEINFVKTIGFINPECLTITVKIETGRS